jgi:hypothetical protein
MALPRCAPAEDRPSAAAIFAGYALGSLGNKQRRRFMFPAGHDVGIIIEMSFMTIRALREDVEVPTEDLHLLFAFTLKLDLDRNFALATPTSAVP